MLHSPLLCVSVVTLALLGVAGLPATLPAQVVRGQVRDAQSGAAIGGALVSVYLADAIERGSMGSARPRVETLSHADGRYAVATGGAGRYVIVVKRIGAQRFVSPPFDLAAGATHEVTATLQPVAYTLPQVAIRSATTCTSRGADAVRVARLWEEARTALTATAVSRTEERVTSTVTRYRRMLAPESLRVINQTEAIDRSRAARPFVAVDPDSLTRRGYAWRGADGMVQYFAPDEAILLSDAFLAAHCFGVMAAGSDSVGLTFEPVRGRRETGIRGVLWLDALSFELRRVDFRYLRLPLPVDDPRAGGEVHFARLPDGAWLISRWWLRVPHVEWRYRPIDGSTGVRPMPVLTAFAETGGWAVPDAAMATAARGHVVGRVVDSTGVQPLMGARVVALGSGAEAAVGADGTFRFDSLPVGRQQLVVRHPAYARLGVTVAQVDLDVGRDTATVPTLRAPTAKDVLWQWCARTASDSVVAARFLLPAAAAMDSIPTRSLRLTWRDRRRLDGGMVQWTDRIVERPIDPAGGATVCDLQPGAEVLVEERRDDGRVTARSSYPAPWNGWQLFELTRVRWSTPR